MVIGGSLQRNGEMYSRRILLRRLTARPDFNFNHQLSYLFLWIIIHIICQFVKSNLWYL